MGNKNVNEIFLRNIRENTWKRRSQSFAIVVEDRNLVFVFYYRAKNIFWACFIMLPRIFWEVLAEVSLAEVVELLQFVL